MDLNSYQDGASRTMNPQSTLNLEQRLASFGLGIAGEAGEVADYLKKVIFHEHPLDRAKLADELGDVLWYVAALATINELSLDDVAEGNLAKLRRRYPEGFSSAASLQRVDVYEEREQ